jgi:phosphohistidine swiveling domain-containing protein
VFKDGDLVEVDANKGIIKLIKQFMPRSPRTIWRSNFSIPRADMTLMAESQLGQYNLQDKTNGAKIIKRMLWVIKRGDNIAAYFDRDELRRMCEQTVKTILDKPAHIDKIHLQTASYNNKHFKFAETVRRRDLTKFSDKQLLQLHKKLWQLQYLAHCWSQPTTWFLDSDGEDYSRYLYDLTVAKVKSSPTLDAATAFSILTTPDKKSLSYIEEQESLRLLEFINGNKKVKQWFIAHQTRELVKDFSLLPPGIRSRLYAHYIKWRWTPYTYIGPAYELDYYLEVWRGLLREKLDPKKKLKQLTAKTKNIQAERKRLIKLLNLTPYQNHLFDIAAEIVWLKGFRKECYYHGYFVLDLVLGEMARRSGITLLQAKYLLPQELPLLFHGKSKQLAKIASDRWRFSVTYFNQGRQQVMAGAKAKNFLKKQRIEKTQVIKAEQLKGMCACPGNAKGVARVINVPADMPKMKAGDIMVSHNTYPSLVPAMKKAAAIITEEGGITCHAAIVSREMQIPCIVGVKGLLQALKDGDKLAVDATQGTIKVIKRK